MKKIILLIFIVTAVLLWGFYIEPDMLTVKEYKISSPDFSGQNLRIVFASDFHLNKNQEKQARRITDKINSENPDIIILGGDFVKGDCPEKSMLPEHVAKELSNLKAPYGVYAVTGNHDSWFDEKRIISALEEKNISVLNNKNKKLELNGKVFYIAGIEDLTTGKPNLDKAFQNTSAPVIFVSHSPDIFLQNPYKPFLTLSGHTHGGQIRLPFFGALVVPSKYGNKYAQGKFEKGSQNLIVTKGLGTSILPFRFNCTPEIVVVEISGNTIDEENEIDKAEKICISKDYTTYGMLSCTQKAIESWDKEIHKYDKLLKKNLSGQQKQLYIEAQKEWQAYKAKEFDFINEFIINQPGTMHINIAKGDQREIVKSRALQLKYYYEITEKE